MFHVPGENKRIRRNVLKRILGPSYSDIAASIMSKKLAENLYRLVLDVKFGSGAFMKTRKEAKQLGASMTKVRK